MRFAGAGQNAPRRNSIPQFLCHLPLPQSRLPSALGHLLPAFFATVIAYVDRGVIAYLKNTLESVIPGLNDRTYGYITAAFTAAYAIGMVVAGGFTDKLGTRKAFAIAICLWSIAAMLPGAAFSVITFAIAMFLLGLGEAANFPACIKTVAEWFPQARARPRHRNLQLRRQHRQHCGAHCGADAGDAGAAGAAPSS